MRGNPPGLVPSPICSEPPRCPEPPPSGVQKPHNLGDSIRSFADKVLDLVLGYLSILFHCFDRIFSDVAAASSQVMAVDVSIPLRKLRTEVERMTGEEQVVLWVNNHRESQECRGVGAEGKCHLSRDAERSGQLELSPSHRSLLHIRALLCVNDCGDRDPEGTNWPQEVWGSIVS